MAVQRSALLTRWHGPVASGRATALASTSHAQYDRTTAAPADGQIERVRGRGEAVDPAHGNPDLAIAEPLGHAREPATVRLHVDIDNPHPARRRRRSWPAARRRRRWRGRRPHRHGPH